MIATRQSCKHALRAREFDEYEDATLMKQKIAACKHALRAHDFRSDECRKCGGDSRVIRVTRPRRKVTRRRECVACGVRWTTFEVAE